MLDIGRIRIPIPADTPPNSRLPTILHAIDEEVARLRAQLAEAVAVLRALEWPVTCIKRPYCPMCGLGEHAPGCRLSAILKGQP
jgi:hypothetical protein